MSRNGRIIGNQMLFSVTLDKSHGERRREIDQIRAECSLLDELNAPSLLGNISREGSNRDEDRVQGVGIIREGMEGDRDSVMGDMEVDREPNRRPSSASSHPSGRSHFIGNPAEGVPTCWCSKKCIGYLGGRELERQAPNDDECRRFGPCGNYWWRCPDFRQPQQPGQPRQHFMRNAGEWVGWLFCFCYC